MVVGDGVGGALGPRARCRSPAIVDRRGARAMSARCVVSAKSSCTAFIKLEVARAEGVTDCEVIGVAACDAGHVCVRVCAQGIPCAPVILMKYSAS